MNDGIDNSLGAEWDELSLEFYGKLSPEQRNSVSITHRAFHHGALAALLCLHRGAKFEDLVAEGLAACAHRRYTALTNGSALYPSP